MIDNLEGGRLQLFLVHSLTVIIIIESIVEINMRRLASRVIWVASATSRIATVCDVNMELLPDFV